MPVVAAPTALLFPPGYGAADSVTIGGRVKLLELLEQREQGMVLYCVVHRVVVLGRVETGAADEEGSVDGSADADTVTVEMVMVCVSEEVVWIV